MSNVYKEQIVFAGTVGFLNGLLPVNLSDSKVFLPESVEEQARKIMRNFDELLAQHDLSRDHLIAVQIFLKDFHRFHARLEVISEELFGASSNVSKSVVGVQALTRDALISMNFVVRTTK